MLSFYREDTSDIVNRGRLKDNIGKPNYEIPTATDLAKYNTVLVWCKAFSTLFWQRKTIKSITRRGL